MKRHAKASSAGSNQRQATGLGRILGGAFACLFALFAFAGIGASSASAKPLYNVIGTGGTAGGQFFAPQGGVAAYVKGPHGPAVNHTGEGPGAQPGDVYVADTRNRRIQQFDATGEFIRAFGQDVIVNSGSPANSNGTGYEVCDTTAEPPNTPAECKAGITGGTGGAMNDPGAVAIDQEDGSVYVFDAGNHRIQKLTSEGTFVWASGKDVLTGGGTAHEVCIVDAECKVGAAGARGGEIGAHSIFDGNGQRGIAVSPVTGSVYFGDLRNNRVQELTPAGAFVRAFGWDVASSFAFVSEFGAANLSSAIGVAAYGAGGEVYVSDRGDDLIHVFGPGPTRSHTSTFDGSDTDAGAFADINRIAVHQASGSVYALDNGPDVIDKFNLAGEAVDFSGPETSSLDDTAAGSEFGLGGDSDIAVDNSGTASDGNFYVLSYQGGHDIHGYDSDGEFLFTIDGATIGSDICGLAVDPDGDLWFADFAGSLNEFDSSGAPAAGSVDTTPQGIKPCHMTIDPAGNFYVAEYQGAVHKYDPSGAYVGKVGPGPIESVAIDPSTSNVLAAHSGKISEYAGSSSGSGAGTEFEECTVAAECVDGAGGAGVGQFGGVDAAPGTVAVDSTGAVYTAETDTAGGAGGTGLRMQKFTPQAGPPALAPSIFAPAILEDASPESGPRFAPRSVTVDPDSDDVYVAIGVAEGEGMPPADEEEFRVLQLDSAGTELIDTSMANLKSDVESILPEFRPQSVNGLAFDPNDGLLYVATSSETVSEQRVYVFGEGTPPSVTLADVTDVTSDSATVHGSVTPNGGLDTTYRVEFRFEGSGIWNPVGDPVNAGAGEAPVAIEHTVSGLPANSDLWIRIVATKPFESSRADSNEIQIQTAGAAPVVQTGQAWWNGSAELALSGTVNPRHANTLYHFEYGPTDDYGQSVPVNRKGPAGLGEAAKQVVQQLYDLDTDTAFHYRLVATNRFGTTVGEDRVVAAHDESWVYELVSDAESNGLGVLGINAISDDGRRVALSAQTLGDPPALPGQTNSFVAQLESDRWAITRLGPDPSIGSMPAVAASVDFSADLTALLFPQRTTVEAMAQEGRWSIARIDGSNEQGSPHLVPLERIGDLSHNQGASFELASGSADLSTFFFKKTLDTGAVTYLPGEPLVSRGYPVNMLVNIYRVSEAGPGATLSLANIGPSGEPLANVCGAWVGTSRLGVGHSARPVSRDGSTIYFSARPTAPTTGSCSEASHPLRIYKRTDGASTVRVSESQCDRQAPDPPCSTADGNDIFQGASSDGSRVFFTSDRQLTDSDLDETEGGFFGSSGCGHAKPPFLGGAPFTVGCDLYLYDSTAPEGERLTQVSAGEETTGHPTIGSRADVLGVVESSTDGSRVYFVAKGQLTEEATQGANNLFVYERSEEHPAGRIEFVAALAAGDSLSLWSEGGQRAAYVMPFNSTGGPAEGDGHLLFFRSVAKLLPEDEDFSGDLYRYDDEAEELTCASCEGDGEFNVSLLGGEKSSLSQLQRTRTASEDGSAATFITQESMLPEDENSVRDVYVWREGDGLSLVSGATGQAGIETNSHISPDGQRVFFITKAALHPGDRNSALDAYAASVGGGLPLPRPAASRCEDGQSCRGDAPAPPAAASPDSASFQGAGNLKPKANPCTRRARRAQALSKRAKALRRKAKRSSNRKATRRNAKRARRAAGAARRNSRAAKRCRRRANRGGKAGKGAKGNRGANTNRGGNR